MCDCSRMNPNDVVVPTALPLGGFKPCACCLCGRALKIVRFTFTEGTVCSACYAALPGHIKTGWADYVYPEGSTL